MSPASQDYRDGAAYGAQELARRLTQVERIGIPFSAVLARQAADTIQSEMGGYDHAAAEGEQNA